MRDRQLNTGKAGDSSDTGGEAVCLGARQRAILQFIQDYGQHYPYAPTLREIARGVGLRSSSTVNAHVQYLAERGYLRKGKGTSRTLVLLEAGRCQLEQFSVETMAADPAIQQEQTVIQMAFAVTQGDGLTACEGVAGHATPSA